MKTKVLVIEDDDASRHLFTFLLEQQGCQVSCCHTAQRGLEAAGKHSPDLIIMDYQLPDMNGCDLMEQLRQNRHTERTPVLVVSAQSLIPEQCRSVLQAGACEILEKPVDPDTFVTEALSAVSAGSS